MPSLVCRFYGFSCREVIKPYHYVIMVWALLLSLAVYLNIGWALGTHYYEGIQAYHNGLSQTFLQRVINGPANFFIGEKDKESSKLETQIVLMFLWPVGLLIIIISWLIYFLLIVLWVIFAGGLAKLCGIG